MENSNCMKMMKDVSALFRKNIDNALKEENITMTQLGRLEAESGRKPIGQQDGNGDGHHRNGC